ncbi:NifB/NifX family molybdenum-iron cluster-binding protein [Azonexus sp.]|uniref:NifB/NifX family molybdenum-iron cluster-binding protein n=1 Tax=Azonexus sp. TaxID=1872668 RepID=UPI0039E2D40F
MRIAITSQNRRNITEHAGKCRKFWIYEVKDHAICEKTLLELPLEQSLHAQRPNLPTALAGINVLISASMGRSLYLRLREQGVLPLIACEDDPDLAVRDFLSGKLLTCSPNAPHAHPSHATHHDHDESTT